MIEFDSWENVPKNFTGVCVTKDDGDIRYYLDGKLHRLDGPAVERVSGMKHWFVNGVRHRLDGPAMENPNFPRAKQWWINGSPISKKKFDKSIEVRVHQKLYKAGLEMFI